MARSRAPGRPAARAPRLRLPVPGLRAVPAPERLAQRRLRAQARYRGGERRERADRGAQPLRRRGARRRPARASSRVASASGWRWRGRSPATRRCCCSTSRSRRSTRRTAAAAGARARRDARRGRGAGDPGHPRLRRGGAARRPDRGHRSRSRDPVAARAAELSAQPGSAFVADFTGAAVLFGTARRRRPPGPPWSPSTAAARCAAPIRPRARSGSPSTRGRSRSSPPGTEAHGSALNRLEARVTSVTEVGSRARIGLLAGQPLVAEITGESLARLGLAPGVGVVATWKATATRLVAR